MGPRIAIKKLAPEAHQHLYALDGFLKQSSLDLWNRIAVTTQMVAGSWRQPAATPDAIGSRHG